MVEFAIIKLNEQLAIPPEDLARVPNFVAPILAPNQVVHDQSLHRQLGSFWLDLSLAFCDQLLDAELELAVSLQQSRRGRLMMPVDVGGRLADSG